ncbi:MAG: class I SAM-dependent methyltransferase [Candidatus Limnocylindria bacterium]
MRATERRRFCCDEDLARIGCDGLHADEDLEKWRSGRLHPATQELIDVVRAQGIEGAALLDIGAGVGAVHLTLLEGGAATAVDIDASPEYLATARAEAERRGLAGRVEYRYGDVVELAAEMPPADIVTLDSVICCYPYLAPLLEAATRPGPQLVGLTYPRDVWWMRAFMRLFNLTHALRRRPDRYFIHRHARLNRLMADAGYENAHEGGTREWRVVVYRRAGASRAVPSRG